MMNIPRKETLLYLSKSARRREIAIASKHDEDVARGCSLVARVIKRTQDPHALVILAECLDSILEDAKGCTCTVSMKTLTISGESNCAVHGFRNHPEWRY
jgi:hypothetical protein